MSEEMFDNFTIDDSEGVDINEELDEIIDDSEDDTEEPEVKQEEKEKMVPLKALEAERNKWKKKLEQQKNMQHTKSSSENFDEDSFLEKEIAKYRAKGWDDDTAKTFAETNLEHKKELFELKNMLKDTGKSATNIKREIEIENLSKDSFYLGLEDSEIREEVETLSDKTGLSIKQAYNALYGEKSRAEIKQAIENEVVNNSKKRQSAYVDFSSNGQPDVKSKVNLSPEEAMIAKMAKMSPSEYLAMKKMNSTEQFKKFKSNKKG